MGTTSSKMESQSQPQSPALIKTPQFLDFLKKLCFEVPNGIIYKPNYEAIMVKLETFQIITLVNTPLGDRLFMILTKNNGKISTIEFYEQIMELAMNKEKRIYYTFLAYQNKNGIITLKEFQNFFNESWQSAFHLLPNKTRVEIEPSLIYQWAKQQLPKLEQQSSAIFNKFDIQKQGYLDKESFKQYLLSNIDKNMYAKHGDCVIKVPLTLLEFYSN